VIAVALYSGVALAQDGQLGTAEPEIEPGKPAAGAHLGRMDNNLSIFGILGLNYDIGLGVGVRYQKTLVPEGFIRNSSITDDLGIEGSFEFRHYGYSGYYYNEYDLGVGVVWNLWFTEQFAAYPKLGLGYGIASWSDDVYGDDSDYGGFLLWFAAGVVYKLDAVSLRAEVGTNALQLGVGFTL